MFDVCLFCTLSALKVHQHPLVWNVPRRMAFIRLVEEATTSKPNMGPYFQRINDKYRNETIMWSIIMGAGVNDWKLMLDQSFQDYLYDLSQRTDFSQVTYSGSNARDLIRLIRNTMSHHGNLPPELEVSSLFSLLS